MTLVVPSSTVQEEVPTQTPTKVRTHYPLLDYLRAVFVDAVLFAHANWTGGAETAVGSFATTGFFLLSGYLISGILIRARDEAVAAGKGFWDFYVPFIFRRVFRIFPLFFLYLGITWILKEPRVIHLPFEINLPFGIYLPVGSEIGVTKWWVIKQPESLWWYATYLANFKTCFGLVRSPNLYHIWTLCVEEHVYLFLPLVIWFTPPKYRIKAYLFMIALSVASWVLMTDKCFLPERLTSSVAHLFLFGSLLAEAQYAKKLEVPAMIREVLLWVVCGGIFLALGFRWELAQRLFVDIVPTGILGRTVIGGMCALLIAICVTKPPRVPSPQPVGRFKGGVWKIREFVIKYGDKFIQFNGRISYGLYVWHPLVYALLDKQCFPASLHSLTNFRYFAGELVASFAVAWASWRYFEGPILKLRDKIWKP